MGKFQNISGEKFGRLTVISRAQNTSTGSARWNCACECGNTVTVDAGKLKSGHTKSCGCLRAEQNRTVALKHGMHNTRIHRIWMQMHARCNARSGNNYKWYAERGVKVCNEWSDFQNFYQWSANNGYADDLSIDRIDVDGDYSPENCRWVDIITQANNKRNNFKIEYGGRTQTIPQWARETSLPAGVIRYRILHGWTPEEALFTNVREKRGSHGST